MPSLTRGPLPTSVYWRRRLVLLTVAVILVVAIARLLGQGSDASSASPGPDAQGVANVTSGSTAPSDSPTARHTRHTPRPSVPTSSAPAEPTGPCQRSDVLVTPRVDQAVVGDPVTITLDVSTISEPACYWQLSRHTAQVRISRGGATIWSTVDCGQAMPRQRVVARQGEPTSVSLTWAGHRSGKACSSHDPWVDTPGRYWVSAAALGGEPSTSAFLLLKTAPAPTESATPSESASPSTTATPSEGLSPTGRSRSHATAGTSPSYTAD